MYVCHIIHYIQYLKLACYIYTRKTSLHFFILISFSFFFIVHSDFPALSFVHSTGDVWNIPAVLNEEQKILIINEQNKTFWELWKEDVSAARWGLTTSIDEGNDIRAVHLSWPHFAPSGWLLSAVEGRGAAAKAECTAGWLRGCEESLSASTLRLRYISFRRPRCSHLEPEQRWE